jgi:membrane associated rhomboid family serine protease
MAMGIYDREYYRREGPSFLGSLARTGQACKWLILINGLVFLAQLLTLPRHGVPGDGVVTDWLLLEPARVLHGEVWRLLTYAFLHSPYQLLHIVFNMLFLWWFGSELEGLYGSREFVTLYLVSALLGGVAFQAYAMSTRDSCLGASGAVTAVMVLYACHFPSRVIYLFFMLPVPIWAFVAFMVAVDSLYFVGGIRTQTAVVVHLAGAAFAFAYYKLHWRLSPAWTWLLEWKAGRARPRLRVYHGEEEPAEPVAVASPPTVGGVDEHLEAKLDAVLEKVARSGQASLTEGERAILLRASEIYKRRRS